MSETPRKIITRVLLVALLAGAFWPVPVLVVIRDRTDYVVWSARLRKGQLFMLEYIHPVRRMPVIEEYREDRQGMRMTRTPDKLITALPLRINAMTHPRLSITGGPTVELASIAGDGASVTIAVRRRPLLFALW